MSSLLLVALGGAAGSAARYVVDGLVYHVLPATFPWGTAVVNLVGCAAVGLLAGAAEEHLLAGSPGRALLIVGLLGGFTTFSAFAWDTVGLLRAGRVWAASANAASQVALGILALAACYELARSAR